MIQKSFGNTEHEDYCYFHLLSSKKFLCGRRGVDLRHKRMGRSKKFKTEEAAVRQKPHLLTTLTGKNQTNSNIGEKEESSFSITASRKRISIW